MSIDQISNSIDNALNRPTWTKREFAFYEMLLLKVKQYRDKGSNQTEDVTDIRNNISVQPWYLRSYNQGTITNVFQGLKIARCQHQGGPEAKNYHYKLDLLLNDRIHLVMEVVHDARASVAPPYHFRVYYERDFKAHIAAFTPMKTKGHVLPEYDQLTKLFPTLEKHEIICLAIEILLYYDVDGIMSRLPIGNNYPICLPQLMDGITEGLRP